jgi:hypothetical protein
MPTSRLTHWLCQFCTWHDNFKSGTLGAELLPAYMQARLDLTAVLVMAQCLDIRTNDGGRRAVRVARAVPVEFDLGSGRVSTLTHDISVSGISALLGEAPAVGAVVGFRLKLGRDIQPATGRCRVVANIQLSGSVRMAATFEEISKEGRGRIETLVLDAACADLRAMLRNHKPEVYTPSPPQPAP